MFASPRSFSFLAMLAAGGLASPVAQAATWLDQGHAANWNRPAAAIPQAPKDVQSAAEHKQYPVELKPKAAEERAAAAAGWSLYIPTDRKGTLAVVWARTADTDGMGRPHHLQALAFSKGRFAGTLSPDGTMAPRTDGVIGEIKLVDERTISATFLRYGAADALCCPSRESRVTFTIDAKAGAPVVVPGAIVTVANPG